MSRLAAALSPPDLRGVIVPLVTPFAPDGAVDVKSFTGLCESLLADGVHGFALAGTTGESPTLRWTEIEALLLVLRDLVKGRVPVLVGTGTYDTAESVARTERARELGADGALVVVPYYSRPAPAGVIEHFRRIAAVGLPIVAYNIPYRTGLALAPETLRAILALPGVVGLKESSGGLGNLAALAGASPAALLCGEDHLFLDALAAGAPGGIIAVANLIARELCAIYRDWCAGRPLAARAGWARVRPLVAALFREPNPAPIKWALARRGQIAAGGLRLPLVPITEGLASELASLLAPPAPALVNGGPTRAELVQLCARFHAQEIPPAEWTHAAHLQVGAWHVAEHGPDAALERMRAGILRLNARHGTPETPTRGYHETITRAYVELFAGFFARFAPGTAAEARVAAVLASPLAQREALFAYYDRERLLSAEARARWVEPDRPFS